MGSSTRIDQLGTTRWPPRPRSSRKLTFTLEAGQVRYVRLNIAMGLFVGRVYGELIDEAKGKEELSDLRYTGTQP